MMKRPPSLEYLENVMKYLEYLNFPPYVSGYNPEDVSKSIYEAARSIYESGYSYRMAALVIFAFTLEKISTGQNIKTFNGIASSIH